MRPSIRNPERINPADTAAAATAKGAMGMCPARHICVSNAPVAHVPTICTKLALSSPLSAKYDSRSMFPSRPASCPCHEIAASASGRPAAMSPVFLTICGIVRKRKGTVAHDAMDVVTLSHRARVRVTHDGTLASLNGGATGASSTSKSHGLTRSSSSVSSS